MKAIDCAPLSVRQINESIRRLIEAGEREIVLRNPGARHNLAVAVLTDAAITIDGPVGYYAGGMSDGVQLDDPRVGGLGPRRVHACRAPSSSTATPATAPPPRSAAAPSSCAATPPRGPASSMKGGLLVIGGGCGYMTGFMMQRGRIIVCGDAGDALADSMYEGVIYVGGEIAALGNDAVVSEASAAELAEIRATLAHHGARGAARLPEGRVRTQALELRQEGAWRHGRRAF